MIVTDHDYELLEQSNLIFYIKLEIRSIGTTINENTTILDNLEGILVGGNITINAESDVRRTASITIVPIEGNTTIANISTLTSTFDLSERSKVWLNKNAILYLGLLDIRTNEINYYKMGTFVFQSQDITYDNTTNQMSISLSDLMTLLDGTINGQLGQLTTLIPAYVENPDTGEVVSYNIIRDAMISTITQLGNVSRYIVDDIGEFKGIRQYNESGWKQYRNTHPLWNNVPYDLDFSTGSSVVQVVDALRDIYPNNETFFDADGVFRCQMIPSMYYDDIAIPDYMLQRYLISESTNRDFTTVRNVSEVWGQVLEIDFYTEDAENINGVYVATIDGLDEEYKNNDRVAIKIPAANIENQAINLNGYGNVTIYNVTTEEPIKAGTLEAGRVYVFYLEKEKIKVAVDPSVAINEIAEYSRQFLDYSNKSQRVIEQIIALLHSASDITTQDKVDTIGKSIRALVDSTRGTLNPILSNLKALDHNELKKIAQEYASTVTTLRTNNTRTITRIIADIQGSRQQIQAVASSQYTKLVELMNQLSQVNSNDLDNLIKLFKGNLETSDYSYKFFLQGQWQIHAMCVLTDGTVKNEMWTDPSTGLKYPLYSMDYFKNRYNCDNVEFMINPESPFTIQKIGVRLAVYSGSEYSAIYTDDLAIDRAHFENWKTARLTDNITLTTVLMPFLDVNAKVSYRMQNSTEVKQYIIKNVSHDFSGFKSSITMMTFYPLYESRLVNNKSDAFLSLKGTQNFESNNYINATSKNRADIAVGNIVWVMYHGNYVTATVGGKGGTTKVGNKNVNGIPWVSLYDGGADNIRNYLFNSSYRISTVKIVNRYQSNGQFKYQILSAQNKVLANGINDSSGCIRFSSIDTSLLPLGSTTIYAVQIAGSDRTITYDRTRIPITINISTEGNARYYECVYEIEYTNTY